MFGTFRERLPIKQHFKLRGQISLEIGSFVAPIWAGTGGGYAMGNREERDQLKASNIGKKLRDLGIRLT
jgi:hypothetical protein|tara:strand:- start:471 stop:677 length:207 start_codon:yes stop_codon:yes gene_type:complete